MTQMPSPDAPLNIGTRGSPLALAQAFETRSRLAAAMGLTEDCFAVVPIKTTGDRVQDRALRDLGGKGLFTKEIEDALLDGSIDIAVHSMKDMPVEQPEGLILDTWLPREDVRDAFVAQGVGGIADLPQGAVVGTSSLRRRAQLLARRPDLQVVEFRGNLQTRMRKLSEGVAQATFLAMAGLNRLDMQVGQSPIAPEDMLPAVAQGAIGIERRCNDPRVEGMLAAIRHGPTAECIRAERAFLATLDGSCQTPIAGLALHDADGLWVRGEILRPDGSVVLTGERRGPVADGPAMGIDLARDLLGRAGHGFFG